MVNIGKAVIVLITHLTEDGSDETDEDKITNTTVLKLMLVNQMRAYDSLRLLDIENTPTSSR